MSAPAKGGARPIIIKKIKKVSGGGHHGGAWKVAYADFVTAMMALFIVLWLLTQADMKVRQQIASFFRNPGIMPGGSSIGDRAAKDDKDQVLSPDFKLVQGTNSGKSGSRREGSEESQMETDARAIKATLERLLVEHPEWETLRDEVIVQVVPEGLSIQMIDKGGDVLFDLASSELKPGLLQILKRIAPILAQMPNLIQVGGHTDARPYKVGARTNWDLSFERANKARTALEQSGLRQGQIGRVLSYADSEPFNPKDPYASENRRLSILALRRSPLASPRPAAPPAAPPPAR